MAISKYNTDSGSIYPEKGFVDYQLNPAGRNIRYIDTPLIKGGAPVWDKTYIDLTRLGTLQVNGEYVYKNGVPSEIGDEAAKTSFVFNSVATKLDSPSLALKAVDLLEQDLGGGALKRVTLEKGISHLDEEGEVESTHTVTAKRHFNVIDADSKNFRVIHEELIEVRPMEDIEKVSYLKVKTLVKGKTEALEARDASRISTSIAYTKEYSSMEDALKADYWGTKAGGWSNTESYIKE